MSSARAPSASPHEKSKEEEFLLLRSKKKVRNKEGEADPEMFESLEEFIESPVPGEEPQSALKEKVIEMPNQTKILAVESYKDKLLNIFGEEVTQKLQGENRASNGAQALSESQIKEVDEGAGVEIPLSDEEWKTWSLPWQQALVVKVMGRTSISKCWKITCKGSGQRKGQSRLLICQMATSWCISHQERIISTLCMKDHG